MNSTISFISIDEDLSEKAQLNCASYVYLLSQTSNKGVGPESKTAAGANSVKLVNLVNFQRIVIRFKSGGNLQKWANFARMSRTELHF